MSDDILAKAEALYSKLDFEIQARTYWTYEQYFEAAKMLPELIAEIKRMREENETAIIEVRNTKDYVLIMHDRNNNIAHQGNKLFLENRKLKEQLAAKDAAIKSLEYRNNRWQDDFTAKDAELAKWKQIAIEEHVARSKEGGWERTYEEAAEELGIQISQEDDLTIAYMLGGQKANERLKVLQEYVARLEDDYISWVQLYYYDLGEHEAIARAQDALERTRHAKEIHD